MAIMQITLETDLSVGYKLPSSFMLLYYCIQQKYILNIYCMLTAVLSSLHSLIFNCSQ